MRSVKFFLFAIVAIAFSFTGSAQYVQPMRYDHYSVTKQMNIGSGTARVTDASAYLEIGPSSGASKGLLIPRLTTAERDAIPSPLTGLMIYNKTTNQFNFYNGSSWTTFSSGGGGGGISQLGNTGNLWLNRVNDSTYAVDTATANNFYRAIFPQLSLGYANPSWISSLAWSKITGTPLFVTRIGPTDSSGSSMYGAQIGGNTLWFNTFGSENYGLVPPSTGTTTDFLRADGSWAAPSGGGAAGDTIPYSYNPADWLVSLPHKAQPYFYTSGVAGDPPGSYYETSNYTPAPVKITAGVNRGALFVATKGDFHRAIFGWISRDNGLTWDTVGQIIKKSATGWDKAGASMPHLQYDSATNTIRMWYMGFTDSIYPPKFGVGYATASGDSFTTWTKHGEVLSGTSVQSQMGLPHYTGYVKVSSVVKSRETGKYVYHGCYWPGNASNWPDSTMRLWQGVSTNPGDPIDSMQEILKPTGTNTLLENPTVWYGDDGAYWMIFTNGYMDNTPVGGIDSVQYLQAARTVSLKNPVWVKQPGVVFYPAKDSTWQSKRVYNAQLLKNGSEYYDRPISIRHDSAGQDTDGYEESYWLLFYSGSYKNSYHDQSSILRILPQKKSQYTTAIGWNGNMPNIIQKNGSTLINIPFADSSRRISGGIRWEDIRDLYAMVQPSTGADRLAYYSSTARRLKPLPIFSFTTGAYPTFTFGAAGYNAASVYFRNSVGTTGMISEDAGMNYYASSTYKSHIWRDQVSGGIVLGRMWSSASAPYAYFPGKTAFGSNGTATSHLQTDKTFAAPLPAAKTANYTLADDYHIAFDATSGALSGFLPQANGCPGRIYIIKKIDASGNAVTLDGSGTEPIDGSLTYSLTTQWKYVIVQSTGSATTGWYIIGGN
ncbi:MAG: hypothetical protein IAE96_04745 [Chitinophagaceae bacterium]|nr:hypothetical protein [Chitinophagaceae bacterium]